MTIFVSIASYRDTELSPTLDDLFAKATAPESIRVGLCWQHLGDEDLGRHRDDPRLRVLEVDARDSRGPCWARARVMTLYAGEDHYLQLDSHHRFVPGWDTRLLTHLRAIGRERAVLSTYGPAYVPGQPLRAPATATVIEVERFVSGVPVFRGAWAEPGRTAPIPGHFLAGGFLFSTGRFVSEIPYDPELYFHGEEIAMTLRAYTRGWDVFAPPETVQWHWYERTGRPKHWDDHQHWARRDSDGKRRVRALIDGRITGPYGLGDVRTVRDFERATRLDLRSRVDRSRITAPPARPVLPADRLTCV